MSRKSQIGRSTDPADYQHVACAVAARLSRVPLRESVALGALMNARGLIELILLNIGLEAGIITPTLFTILVIVAVVFCYADRLTKWMGKQGINGISKLVSLLLAAIAVSLIRRGWNSGRFRNFLM